MMIRRRVTLTRGLLVVLVLLLGYAAAAEPISALDNFVEREEGVWKIAEDNELFFKELFSE